MCVFVFFTLVTDWASAIPSIAYTVVYPVRDAADRKISKKHVESSKTRAFKKKNKTKTTAKKPIKKIKDKNYSPLRLRVFRGLAAVKRALRVVAFARA